jgi:hypothetical protein
MEQLSFNTLIVPISSLPPVVNSPLTAFSTEATIQGTTTVHIGYNNLNFNVKPYKTIILWNQSAPNARQVLNLNLNPLSTITPNFSAISKYTFSPTTTYDVLTSNILMYYENGVIHSIDIKFNILADDVIDQDLCLVDSQIVNSTNSSILNVESQKYNVLYNQVIM